MPPRREDLPQALIWASWLYTARRARRLPVTCCAREAGVTPRIWTSWEKGRVPGPETVPRIARAVDADPDEAMLMAGYAPVGLSARDVMAALAQYRAGQVVHPALSSAVLRAFRVPAARQGELAELIVCFLDARGGVR